MAESACLMRAFSYHNGLLNEPNNQENNVHALGESVSFGRFTSELLSWEKWSTFPHKRYVEEAKSYAQPGSVAQKKAFFEAHYKRIAAQKAAAAALLEQEKAAAATSPKTQLTHDSSTTKSNSNDLGIDDIIVPVNPKNTESLNKKENLEDDVSVSIDSRTSQTERPLLKSKSNTDQEVMQPMIKKKPSRIPPSPAKFMASVQPMKEKIGTPRTKNRTTRSAIMNSSSVSVSCKLASPSVRKIESIKPPSSVRNSPMRTPTKVFINGANKQPLATPSLVNRRVETPVHPSAAGSKSGGPNWHILSAVSKSLSAYRNKLQSPTISSPFILRTEDRAARRKQKLEEKFNEKQAQKAQQQTKFKRLEEKFNEKQAQKAQQQTKFKDKAETEFRKLRQSFCFKARPLPEFYKERETPKNQIKKTPEVNSKPLTPRRNTPSSTCLTKNKSSRRLWKTNNEKTISGDNMSPNIQRCCKYAPSNVAKP